ncbi:hypothetical protein PGT21_016417 [Puccinia graminis f. sp. tritici]|uniref:Uncharacterized protein n=1 Tax=Puccinia graminis f. sp. tritici TaxID=56615 RepID=A0A5B0Q640_PUCGR|nr:hypothetical protein PGT21_016417 [Puccinia graminis f. sp. tritici]
MTNGLQQAAIYMSGVTLGFSVWFGVHLTTDFFAQPTAFLWLAIYLGYKYSRIGAKKLRPGLLRPTRFCRASVLPELAVQLRLITSSSTFKGNQPRPNNHLDLDKGLVSSDTPSSEPLRELLFSFPFSLIIRHRHSIDPVSVSRETNCSRAAAATDLPPAPLYNQQQQQQLTRRSIPPLTRSLGTRFISSNAPSNLTNSSTIPLPLPLIWANILRIPITVCSSDTPSSEPPQRESFHRLTVWLPVIVYLPSLSSPIELKYQKPASLPLTAIINHLHLGNWCVIIMCDYPADFYAALAAFQIPRGLSIIVAEPLT